MNDQWSDLSLCRRSKREARLGSNYTQTLSSWARNKTMGPVRDWHRPHHLWAKIKKIKTVQCSGIFVDLICILSNSSYGHMLSMHLLLDFVSLDCAGTGYGPLVVSSLCWCLILRDDAQCPVLGLRRSYVAWSGWVGPATNNFVAY